MHLVCFSSQLLVSVLFIAVPTIGDSKGGAWGAMAPPAENRAFRNLGERL